MCVFIFWTNFVWSISYFKKNWARYDQKYILVFMQSTSYSCQIVMKFEFSQRFLKTTEIWNYTKIRPVGAELFHADGRTLRQRKSQTDWDRQPDRETAVTKLIFGFICNFANSPKNVWTMLLSNTLLVDTPAVGPSIGKHKRQWFS